MVNTVASAFKMVNMSVKTTSLAQMDLDHAFQDGALVYLSIGKKSWMTSLTPELLQSAISNDLKKINSELTQLQSAEVVEPEELEAKRVQIREAEVRLRSLDAALPEIFKLGRVELMPKEQLQAISYIEGAARRFLEKSSRSFGVAAGGRPAATTEVHGDADKLKQTRKKKATFQFINNMLIVDVLMGLDKFRTEYWEKVDTLISQYEALKHERREKYPAQWPLLAQFYPPVEQIEDEYYFIFTQFRMAFPKAMEVADIRTLLREKAADEVYRAKAEQLLNEQRVQAQQATRELIESTIRDIRGTVVSTFNDMLTKREAGKPLDKKNIDKLYKMVDFVGKMDFLNDAAFRAQMDEVKMSLDNHGLYKNSDSAMKALENTLRTTVAFAEATTEETVRAMSQQYFGRKLDI